LKKRGTGFNPQRKVLSLAQCDFSHLEKLAGLVKYGGNPEHKFNPGDFGLTPPSYPRKGKSLCDAAEIFSRKDALKLLRKGIKAGLISERSEGKWPRNIWSMTTNNQPLEAQLENPANGTYHGYPLPDEDPFREIVIKEWNERREKA
jgi:hypothetical protein